MQLRILASSSAGNCYLLISDTGETLIIECGINFKKIKIGLDFDYSNVSGVLVTHEHGDHCKGYKEVLAAGLKIYTTLGTAKSIGIDDHHGYMKIDKKSPFMVGAFKVMAFQIEHDVAEPVGFMIDHPESGNILFITDTCYVPYRFPGMNNIIVEANYCPEIMNRHIRGGSLHPAQGKRTERSHMSIDTCRDFLLANDLSAVNNIVLIHLSDSNSNEVEFEQKITAATGKKVTIASPGIVIENFNKSAI